MMEAFNKIGFHAGPTGNLTGIGDWMRRIDAAGIPFFLKATDGYGVLFEAANVAAASGVRHHLVFRLSTRGQRDGFDYDVPAYHKSPEEAARVHWHRTVARLPPEFDAERVWVEPINEVDKNRSEWLGHFAVKVADLALVDGYKVTLFGWSSGEPEREGWETEGMLSFLRTCADRPDQVAVAVHEYDFGLQGYEAVYPYHLGRFQILFDVCDNHDIARPTVHITEWGWSLKRVPRWSQAETYITQANKLYARFSQVKGAAIWNLGQGPEFGDVHDQTQKLIAPLADYAVSRRFPVPDLAPGEDAPVDPILRRPNGQVPDQPDAHLLADVTIPDGTVVVAGAPFFKTWRVQNTGNTAWEGGYRLAHAGGRAMTERLSWPIPEAVPGVIVELSLDLTAPDRPGRVEGQWRLQDAVGNPFGDLLSIGIEVEAARPDCRFITDVTIPDDSVLVAGTRFTKTWRVLNNGNTTWDPRYRLVRVGGQAMAEQASYPMPETDPGEEVNLSLALTVPEDGGTQYSNWQLQDERGRRFGQILFTRIVVERRRASSRFLADVTIPDDTRLVAGTRFTKTWRVLNDGNTTWDEGHHLVHVGGEAMTDQQSIAVPLTRPGEQADLSVELIAPSRAGNYFSDWRLQDGEGDLFGELLFTRIVAQEPGRPAGANNGRYIADITIPDDTRLVAGSRFIKTWRVQNTGDLPWKRDYLLVFVKGNPMGDRRHFPLPAAEPGAQVDISIPQIVPRQLGIHFGDWRLQDDQGNLFGEVIFLRIVAVRRPGFLARLRERLRSLLPF